MAEPAEFLVQTIKELDDAHQAAMTLVFLRQGKLPAHELVCDSTKLVADKYDVTPSAIAGALPQLEQSFLSVRQEAKYQSWGFVHPTFTDAISCMLSGRPDLVELYVQGAKVETLLSEAVCEGATPIRDAVVIPTSASEHLVRRLLEAPDVPDLNRSLFEFLSVRASDSVVSAILDADIDLLRRAATWHWKICADQRIRFLARVHKLHRLPDDVRAEAAEELDYAATANLDISFIDEDDILGLFQPKQLLGLGTRLIGMLGEVIPNRIAELAEQADPDLDIPDQFDQVKSFVDQLQEYLVSDESTLNALQLLNEKIDEAIADVSTRKTSRKLPLKTDSA